MELKYKLLALLGIIVMILATFNWSVEITSIMFTGGFISVMLYFLLDRK